MPTDVDIHDLKNKIEPKLRKGYLTSRVLLNSARFLDETSTLSSAFNDPAHFPFYYHLGTHLPAKSVVELGTGLGLRAACLAQGTKLDHYLGLQPPADDFYPERLARGNIRDHADKKADIQIVQSLINDEKFLDNLNASRWDLAMVSEELGYEPLLNALNLLWEKVQGGGLLVVDYVKKGTPPRQAFQDFCQARKREPVTVKTRYGVGIVQR